MPIRRDLRCLYPPHWLELSRRIRFERGLLPETPEEHQRRADAAAALWRELVRRVAEKT